MSEFTLANLASFKNTKESNTTLQNIAIIDLGSNSFHLIIARLVNGSIQVISRLKQKVQLANGLDDNNILNKKAINRGVNCLRRFAEYLENFPKENVKVVGTYTLRSAVNKNEFLEEAKKVFPFHIDIISGETEAKFIYSGVMHSQSDEGRKFIIDIGGGSTEMIIGDKFMPLKVSSSNMGCVSFGLKFFPNGEISPINFENAKNAALVIIKNLLNDYKKLGWEKVLGSSGTIKTVQQVIMATIDPDGFISYDYLNILKNKVLLVSHFRQIKLAGLRSDRVDVFVPGLAILMALFEAFNIDKMRYSDSALREGLLYSFDNSFQDENIRTRSIQSLILQYSIDLPYAKRVAKTLSSLIAQYRFWDQEWQYNKISEILYYAVILHEIGLVINYPHFQRYSAYILQHSILQGFNIKEHNLLVILVRSCQETFKIDDLSYINGYKEKDILIALRLLRLAILFNKTRESTRLPEIFSLTLDQNKINNWRLTFPSDYLKEHFLLKKDLENESNLLEKLELPLFFE